MTDDAPIAYTLADGTIAAGELPVRMQLWWGSHHGTALGLMTGQNGPLPLGGDPAAFIELGRAAAATTALCDERLWPYVTGSRPDLQQISDELVEAEWEPITVMVDGVRDPADTVDYGGLRFLVGRATSSAPYVMLRPAGHDVSWPALVTVRP